MKKLQEMLSQHAYNEIRDKLRDLVGDAAMPFMMPAVEKALEQGDGKVREDVLINFLDVDSMRVCTNCGAIMEEGWYMNCAGYACSDECAAKMEGITMEQFKKWRIYKDDIVEYLQREGKERNIDELTQDECDIIIDEYCSDCDYFYAEWY